MSRTLKERFLFLGDFEWREWLTSNLVAMFFVTVVVTGGIVLLMYVFAIPSSPWALGTLLVIDVVGVVLVGSVTVDMGKRYEAKHQLAALLSSTNEEHWSYLRDTYVDDRYPHFIIHHFDSRASRAPEFNEEWFNVWAFLHSDPYGTAASQALFQRSPVGRRRYFNEVKEMARRYRAP